MDDLTRRGALAVLGSALWTWPTSRQRALPAVATGFERPAMPDGDATPWFVTGFIDHDPQRGYVHCPSVCEKPDGGLVCCWYAGTREGHSDVAVWLAESARPETASTEWPAWSAPRPIVTARSARDDLDRFVRKVGNGVVFTDASGRMWLVFVTIAVGGWSGSSLNAISSIDGGRSWSPARRLSLSPFFNISELVRSSPVRLASGEIALPIYHECLGKFPEMAWLRPDGDRITAVKSRMTWGRSFLQPSIVPTGHHDAIAYLRDHSASHRLTVQRTRDGGRTWSEPVATPLPNDDSSVAAVRISSGAIVVAFNDSPKGRSSLALAVSPDGIGDWRLLTRLDDEPGMTFDYPFLIRDGRGIVHLVSSWKKKRVRHVAFNEAWVASRSGEPIGETR
ncbi:MAG: exo-alpha-sialidase [Planctomycetia bacterium]